MKLIVIIMTTAILQVSARSFAQRITLHQKNASLEKVIEQIRIQSGYDFFYSEQALKKTNPVTINVDNLPLKEVLDRCFSDQSLSYFIKDHAVVIRLNSTASPVITSVTNSVIDTTFTAGKVVDENGRPLPGVTVTIKGKNKVAVTNSKGMFSFSNINGSTILKFTYIGYVPKEVKAQYNLGSIQLEVSKSDLDEIKVIAYGTTTQRTTVGSIATVSAKDIEKQPVTNVLQALQGRVPGLVVTATNGSPGAMTVTQVRGQNSLASTPGNNLVLSGYNQPLYILDGVPLSNQNSGIGNNASLANSVGGSFFANFGGLSTLNSINPLDIESISVLKDADATSIYGSQGSNGVIIITTKKGKAGKDEIGVSFNTGAITASRTPQMMNTEQYLAARKEALKNSGLTADLDDQNDADILLFDQAKNTNWSKEFFGGTGVHTDTHVNVSGGSENTNYLVSGGYTRETYNFPGNFSDNRLSLHSNFNHQSADKKFSISFGTDYSYDRNNSSGAPVVLGAFLLAPNFPDLLDGNGKLAWSYKDWNFYNNQLGNPLSYLKMLANNANYSLNNTLQISYKILPGLIAAVNAGYNRLSTNQYPIVQLPLLTLRFLVQVVHFLGN